MIDIYLQAFATVLMPQNLLAMTLGAFWGLLAGALPGISTSMGVVLLLSFTYTLAPMTAFVLLIGAYLGGITGGSITSILFGIPGEPSSVPTVIEGYALAKQGRAAYAMWVYLLCSIFGGLFSVFVMILATPLIANFALRFGPAGIFRADRSRVERGVRTVGRLDDEGLSILFFRLVPGDHRHRRHHGRGALHL